MSGESKAFREKYWEERTDQEKIEALADTVRFMGDRLYEVQSRMDELERHSHGPDGLPVVKLKDRYAPREAYHQFTAALRKNPDAPRG